MPNFTIKLDGNTGPTHRPWRKTKTNTIRQYAIELLLRVDRVDEDGREVGFNYAHVRRLILRRFPVVLHSGRYRGKPTRITYDDLWEIARNLNHAGVRLPIRPRRSKGSEPC